ncbi:MAG: class I SAM-dependent methyltransferase [Verrucomicrobia bacterium]|nr:class I SAM-dependent methyltransferase [Verrucomicrobiota bacterium]
MNSFGKLAHGISHFLNRLRFGKGDSYEAGAFWEHRHAKYQSDFRAVADSLADAHDRYPKQKAQFLKFLEETGIKLDGGAHCIEFGCGNGFWTKVLLDAGIQSYCGLDISSTAVRNCKTSIPGGCFERVDLGEEDYTPRQPADLVFSIDVTQHIVEETKLVRFLRNMVTATKPGGHIVLTSYSGFGDGYADDETMELIGKFVKVRKLRWVYAWDLPTLKKHLNGCDLIASAKFWDKTVFAFLRQSGLEQARTTVSG